MKAAIIGASSESLHAMELAKKYGVEVVALDGNPEAEGLKQADIPVCINIADEELTIETLNQQKPSFLIPVPIGRYLTTIGAANEALSLKGVDREAAVLCTDKYAFHNRLQKEHLRDGACILLSQANVPEDDFEGTVKELHYPAILKPRFGSGSRGIFFVSNPEEAFRAMKELGFEKNGRPEGKHGKEKLEDYVLEEAAPGEEYGIDGAVINREFQLILLRKKINTPPPERQAVGYLSVEPNSLYDMVGEYLEKTVRVMGMDDCLFHADLMVDGERLYVTELSARPSGHNLHNLFTPLCTGVDPIEEFIKYQSGRDYSFKPGKTKQMLIHYFDFNAGVIEKIPSRKELELCLEKEAGSCRLAVWNCQISEGDSVEKVVDGQSIMGRGFYILEAEGEKSLLEASELIINQFIMGE